MQLGLLGIIQGYICDSDTPVVLVGQQGEKERFAWLPIHYLEMRNNALILGYVIKQDMIALCYEKALLCYAELKRKCFRWRWALHSSNFSD